MLCIALWIPWGAQAQGTAGSANLPHLGDGAEMTPAAERLLGDRVARALYRDPDYIDDPILRDYLQGIWERLMDAARRRGELPMELDQAYAWQILMGKDRSINAFALPGAYFGVHLGLVAAVSNRDELAAVMAHELSHVTQRHIARLIARQGAQAPWILAAMILGAMAASSNTQGATAVIAGGQAVAAQTQLNFSRDMEREADRVGFGILAEAGYAPQGFVSMFEKLQQSTRLTDSGNFPYLRSHPLSTERIADAQGRVGTGVASTSMDVDGEALLMAVRAKVLSDTSVDALRGWQVSVQDSSGMARRSAAQQAAQWYGACLSALKARDLAQARSAWRQLQVVVGETSPPMRRQASLLGVELALADTGDAGGQAALGMLAQLQKEPSRAILLLTAQAQVAAGKSALAAQTLQVWLADHPGDALAWQQLAQANHAQQRTVAAIRAEAEAQVAQLDYSGAVQRLKAAQDLARQRQRPDEHFDASIVDTRIRQLEQLLREQALER